MKNIAILSLLLALHCHAQIDLSSTNVVTWNAVTNDVAGAPLSTNVIYSVGLFNPGNGVPFYSAVTITNELAVTRVYDQMQREVIYEVRVKAQAFGYTDSDYSDPLLVRRPRGKAGKPGNVGVK
jgi:hypothetical protein